MENAILTIPKPRARIFKLVDRFEGMKHYLELVAEKENLEPISGTSKGFTIKQGETSWKT